MIHQITKKDSRYTIMIGCLVHLGFPFENQTGYFVIIGLCYGLLCFPGRPTIDGPSSLVIWNPSLESR